MSNTGGGGQVGSGYILVAPKLDQAGFRAMGGQAEQALTRSSSGMLTRARGIGTDVMKGMAAGVGIGATQNLGPAILRGVADLNSLGTELELLGNKAGIVFGNQLGVAEEWAAENAAAMGLTERRAIGAAAGIQDLLVPMGFTRDQATGMTFDLMDLSGALSEWSGGTRSSAEVSQIMTAALLGERESLKSLGISITQAEVDQQVLANGMAGTTGQVLQQAQAQATLELITAKSTDAQTAYAEGAGSNARQQAELTARIQTMREELAMQLVPAFGKAMEVGLAFVGGIAAGAGIIADHKELLIALAAAATAYAGGQALGAAIGGVRAFVSGIQASGGPMAAMRSRFSAMAGAINPASMALAGVTLAVTHYIQQKREQEAAINGVRDSLMDETVALEESTRATMENTFADRNQLDDLSRLGISYDDVAAAMNGNTAQRERLLRLAEEEEGINLGLLQSLGELFAGSARATQQTMDQALAAGDLTQAQYDQITSTYALGTASGRYTDALEHVRELLGELPDKSAKAADGTDAQADAMDSGEDAADEYADQLGIVTERQDLLADTADAARQAIDKLTGAVIGVDQATMDYEANVDDLTDSVKENGRQWDIGTEKGRENTEAAQDAAVAIRDLYLANIENGMSHEDAANKAGLQTLALADQLRQAGMTEGQIQHLIGTYAAVPDEVSTNVAMKDHATWGIGVVRYALGQIPDAKRIQMAVDDRASGPLANIAGLLGRITGKIIGGLPGYADGGMTNGPVIAGEVPGEQELVLPMDRPARLRELLARHGADLSAAAGGSVGPASSGGSGAGIHVGSLTVNVTGVMDLADTAAARALAQRIRAELADLEAEDR